MIKSFKCKETEKIWQGIRSRKLPANIQARTLRKLRQLNASICLQDLKMPPSNRLKQLSGKKKEQYSIRINDQWRLCFDWKAGDSYEVEVVDYH
jgi:proteic killer suppression protein